MVLLCVFVLSSLEGVQVLAPSFIFDWLLQRSKALTHMPIVYSDMVRKPGKKPPLSHVWPHIKSKKAHVVPITFNLLKFWHLKPQEQRIKKYTMSFTRFPFFPIFIDLRNGFTRGLEHKAALIRKDVNSVLFQPERTTEAEQSPLR